MLHDLDSTLKGVLGGANVPALVRNAEVEFMSPTETYAPAAATINLFLYDIRECAELRRSEPVVERQAGTVTMRRPATRVECAYLVTAWSGSDVSGEAAVLEQHELLGEVMRVFADMPVIAGALLMGSLATQPFPVPLVTMPGTVARNSFELWSALGGKLRPSFTLIATIALEPDAQLVTAYPVSTSTIVVNTIAAHRIGGTVRDSTTGDPLPDVALEVRELGVRARSGEDGRYTFAGSAAGTYQLHASRSGYVPVTLSITVPGNTPAAFDLALTAAP